MNMPYYPPHSLLFQFNITLLVSSTHLNSADTLDPQPLGDDLPKLLDTLPFDVTLEYAASSLCDEASDCESVIFSNTYHHEK